MGNRLGQLRGSLQRLGSPSMLVVLTFAATPATALARSIVAMITTVTPAPSIPSHWLGRSWIETMDLCRCCFQPHFVSRHACVCAGGISYSHCLACARFPLCCTARALRRHASHCSKPPKRPHDSHLATAALRSRSSRSHLQSLRAPMLPSPIDPAARSMPRHAESSKQLLGFFLKSQGGPRTRATINLVNSVATRAP